MTALVIRGGHLIDPAAGVDGPKDILLKDGRVAEIAGPGKLKSANGAQVLDATGLTVAPGATVDALKGNTLTMTVDGVATPIAAGVYKGKIVLKVAAGI